MHIIDIIIVIIYLILCILIGLNKSKSIRTLKEYTLGRGYFPNIVMITTFFATHVGAGCIVCYIEKIYVFGIFAILARLLSPVSWLIMARIYGENIEQFRSYMSLSDIIELLYGKVARWITNIAAVFYSMGTVAVQLIAIAHIMNYFLGINYSYSIIVAALIIAIYSAFGGVRAVAFTDVFQFAILMIAIPVAFSFLYHEVGGYTGIVQSMPNGSMNFNLDNGNILLLFSMLFDSALPRSSGVYVQRFLICRDSTQLTHCLNIVGVVSFFFTIIICIIGLIFTIKEPDMDPNIVFIHFVTNHVAIGFKGLIIAGLLAMMMSTADSWLNNTSVCFVHDIIRRIIPLTELRALLLAKIFTFIICIMSAFWAIYSDEVITILWITANLWTPITLIPLMAGFVKFRTNSKSFIAAVTIAILSTAISGYIVGELATISLMFGTISSAVGLFGMHYWQLYQGTMNINTPQAEFIRDTVIYDNKQA